MENPLKIEVREISPAEIELLLDYWYSASPEFLTGMGIDLKLFPERNQFKKTLELQIQSPYEHKKAYCVIWWLNNIPCGHSNINPIDFGNEAAMHLNLWKTNIRDQGIKTEFVRKSIPFYFKNFHLKKLRCMPYAANPAPHRVLEKAGFRNMGRKTLIPGSFNFEQEVIDWVITREEFDRMQTI